jgi:isopenicillin-N epimerase
VRLDLGWQKEPLAGRTRFRHEFDWTGTIDPTGYLALPEAIAWTGSIAAPDGGGWPALMAANHALAVVGRDRVAAALRVEPPAPDAMLGSMAALPLPVVLDEVAGLPLANALATEDEIQVQIGPWPVRAARRDDILPRILVRLSAQRYNEAADYDRLADAQARRLRRA